MRDGWESQARNWAEFARTGHDRSHQDINLPVLLDLLPPPGRRTLDLGCGEGRLSRLLRSLGHQVAGADAAPTMVRLAVSHPAAPPAVLADAAALPFREGAFDLVVAYMCLHDMDQMPRAVAESALREPRAPDELIARDPAERRWQRIPMFLHARAVKS
jgi:SAM-dependent methyltransferase